MNIDNLIKLALEEDIGPIGDITTMSLNLKSDSASFELITNENATLCGIEIFKKVFKTLDKNILIKSKYKDGDKIKKKSIIANIYGKKNNILTAERVALNFISHLSGISTLTSEVVELIQNKKTKLLDTRKTTPLYRELEKYAVKCGGGENHRFNLSELIMIKDNHIASCGNISTAIKKAKKYLKSKKKKIFIEVEVSNLNELKEAIFSNPDIIMFDNWKINKLKEAIKLVPKKIKTEISGQINKNNIQAYSKLGADYISTSYMIKNSKWIDFSLNAI